MKKWTVGLGGVLGVLCLALAGAFSVGGLSLMATAGSSMEPGFRAGDLAVLQRAADFVVGDVAAYHSRDLNTVVMHRITAVEGGRYTFRGDNNSWFDPEQPARSQLIGKLMLRVPGGGVWLNRATSRTAIIALGFLLLASGGTHAVVRRRGKRQRRARKAACLRTVPPMLLTASGAVIAAALAAGSLAAIAWNAPADVAVGEGVRPATMTYSYVATVRASAAYDDTTVSQPEPVFRNVAERVDVRFAFESDVLLIGATVVVNAELSTASGWRSTLPLAAPVVFSDKRHTGDVELDLTSVQARANDAAAAIGAPPGGDVAVTVVAEVQTRDGAVFRPELPLVLDPLALRLVDGEKTQLSIAAPVAAPGAEPPVPFSVFGHALPVLQVRRAAVVALGLVLLAAGAIILLMRRALSAPEHVNIHQRYATLLLEVEPVALPAGRPVIEVPQMRGLALLAERYGLMVMHWQRGGVHTYVVFEEHTTYRFRAASMPPAGTLPRDDEDAIPPACAGAGGPRPSPSATTA